MFFGGRVAQTVPLAMPFLGLMALGKRESGHRNRQLSCFLAFVLVEFSLDL